MAFQRLFKRYAADGVTLLETIENNSRRVTHAEFEMLRQGGCGAASMSLSDPFSATRWEVGQFIRFFYDAETPWHFGRIEEISARSPSGVDIRLHGLSSLLNDLVVGGRGKADTQKPKLYRSDDDDWFENDPDREEQEDTVVGSIKEVIEDLYDNYVNPNTSIDLAAIETPLESDAAFASMVFRGEESAAQIIRQLSVSAGWMSWGVDENGIFFWKNLPIPVTQTYQEAVNLQEILETTDRSLMYNRMILSGGKIYGSSNPGGHYTYRRNISHFPSIAAYGEKKISLHMPQLRVDADVQRFVAKFFSEYAGPSKRYEITTVGQTGLLKPWANRVSLLDKAGNVLKTAVPTRIHCTFNEQPYYRLTLGPEDLSFPTDTHPERFEDHDPTDLGDASPCNCQGLSYPLAPEDGWFDSSASSGWTCDGGGGEGTTFRGILAEDLAAPACAMGEPTTAQVWPLHLDKATGRLKRRNCDTRTIYNFDPSLTGEKFWFVKAEKVGGILDLHWVGCKNALQCDGDGLCCDPEEPECEDSDDDTSEDSDDDTTEDWDDDTTEDEDDDTTEDADDETTEDADDGTGGDTTEDFDDETTEDRDDDTTEDQDDDTTEDFDDDDTTEDSDDATTEDSDDPSSDASDTETATEGSSDTGGSSGTDSSEGSSSGGSSTSAGTDTSGGGTNTSGDSDGDGIPDDEDPDDDDDGIPDDQEEVYEDIEACCTAGYAPSTLTATPVGDNDGCAAVSVTELDHSRFVRAGAWPIPPGRGYWIGPCPSVVSGSPYDLVVYCDPSTGEWRAFAWDDSAGFDGGQFELTAQGVCGGGDGINATFTYSEICQDCVSEVQIT